MACTTEPLVITDIGWGFRDIWNNQGPGAAITKISKETRWTGFMLEQATHKLMLPEKG